MVQNSDNIDTEPAEVSTKKYQPKVKLAEYRPRWIKKDLNLAHEEAKFQWKAVPHEPTVQTIYRQSHYLNQSLRVL